MRISELISKIRAGDKRARLQLEAMFAGSTFGLQVDGLPNAQPGQKIRVDSSGSATMQNVADPDGKEMIKACADPELFDINYPHSFNVTMTGVDLLDMAEKMPDVEGILICCATEFISLPLYKADYARLRQTRPVRNPRKWWQFWKASAPAP